MQSPDQPTPQPSTSQGNGEAESPKPNEKTDQTSRASFDHYTIVSSVSTNNLEAHEQRLKKLNEIAADLHKDEWMFIPVEKLLGNYPQ